MSVLILFIEQRERRVLAPPNALVALLRSRYFNGRTRERRLLHKHLVARGNFDFPVAAVQRLRPDKRGRIGRAPGEVARPQRHAVNGDAICDRQLCNRMSHLAGAVPNVNVVRKPVVRRDIRIRLSYSPNEKVFSVRRDVELCENTRCSNRRDRTR
jgi:hypothetical protein